MFRIIPLTRTNINFDEYIKISKAILGVNPVEELEKKKTPIEGVSAFIRSLIEGLDINQSNALAHINYCFIVVGSTGFFFDLLKLTNTLNITTIKSDEIDVYFGIVSGNLRDWKRGITENLVNNETNLELRYFFNQIQTYLENSEGLFRVFNDLSKISNYDGSFKLKELPNK